MPQATLRHFLRIICLQRQPYTYVFCFLIMLGMGKVYCFSTFAYPALGLGTIFLRSSNLSGGLSNPLPRFDLHGAGKDLSGTYCHLNCLHFPSEPSPPKGTSLVLNMENIDLCHQKCFHILCLISVKQAK